MNTNKNTKKACIRGEEIVSYLYDEMPVSGREVFETHLLECSACTDEFAGLSFARLDVYEWNSYEFAGIPTPEIVIPYENTVRVSWFESWFGPIFSAPKWAAGGALAVAALVFGFVLFPSSHPENNVLIGEVKSTQPPSAIQNNTSALPVVDDKQIVEAKLPNLLNTSDNRRVVTTPIRASGLSVRGRKINSRIAAVRTVPKTKNINQPPPPNAPRLTNFEDDDDNTLRLADLIADLNTDQ